MKVYADGNHLLDALAGEGSEIGVRGDRDKSRANLAQWLALYAQRQDCDVTLVFDQNPVGEALPPIARCGRVRVVNLEPGGECLHEIAGPANRAARDERVFVVTADWRLAKAMRGGRVRLLDPAGFLARARRMMGRADDAPRGEPDGKFSGLPEQDVDYWMRFFAQSGKDPDERRPPGNGSAPR